MVLALTSYSFAVIVFGGNFEVGLAVPASFLDKGGNGSHLLPSFWPLKLPKDIFDVGVSSPCLLQLLLCNRLLVSCLLG